MNTLMGKYNWGAVNILWACKNYGVVPLLIDLK